MGEFELIQHYFASATQGNGVILGIGDDAAILSPGSKPMLVSVDTLISGVHFPEQTSAADIACKALAVNVSDIAAMGGIPRWFTLALTLPDSSDGQWLAAFAAGLATTASHYNVSLVGGDTTRGPLSITINIIGEAEQPPLRRDGAKAGDKVYVTGTLGDAAAALPFALGEQSLTGKSAADTMKSIDSSASVAKQTALIKCLKRLNRPQARTDVAPVISRFASACIDVSDGLLQDLGHILKASLLNAALDPTMLPISKSLRTLHDPAKQQALALSGGDDYELLFTVPAIQCVELEQAVSAAELGVTAIGALIVPNSKADYGHITDQQGQPLQIKGFQHF